MRKLCWSSFTLLDFYETDVDDVIGLIDKDCNTVVEYTYDSMGELLSTTGSLASTLGVDQPFRYRGYVYDTETGWYYLQSRYYDPTTCRFISADVLFSTGQGVLGHNAYAYCGNNPITRVDSSGHFWLATLFLTTAVVLCATALAGCSENSPSFYNPDKRKDINMQYDGKSLSITAYVQFSGDGPDPVLIIAGIEEYWYGVYVIDGNEVTLNTKVIEGESPLGGHLPIVTSSKKGRSGSMYIYGGGHSNDKIKWIAAHEFGHQIGLYDAYKKLPNNVNNEGDIDSVMNWYFMEVTAADVSRAIKYIRTGEMQAYN